MNGNSVQDASLKAYLKEIGQTPLLSLEREIELARTIKSGWHLLGRDQKSFTDEEKDLFKRVEEAKEEFTRANLRLVVSIARRYQGLGIPMLDLIQEGNLGLMRAVEKFDIDRGFRFSTYATHWIKQAMSAAITGQGRGIRVPVHVHDQLVELNKVRRDLEQRLGREPSVEEVAKAMGVSVEKFGELSRLLLDVVSLESPLSQEGDATLLEVYSDEESEPVDESILRQDLREALEKSMSALTPHEQEILRFRFGLDDSKIHNLEETSKRFSVSRERVRQIETRAINRLRRSDVVEQLKAAVRD
ncbi:RNA polymerase, sigma subunit, RpsC/SigC [Ferrithrix thermotolerans DSM 19514]|uniref:RNA polymerase sigma factor n=1 Tax=Ferrithrix thermotolerans DSM 19514 TaxID=1121881 RepID=A0A1M4US38_9ACTN|nr:sigma-70 family RNA polymerase sigma factor [Ferrithrix thermotolerans]SHE59532.1 RNA polymerase, sigma subunit, RpsC/SigC [Ferrithrix thermotolerans DSM 19514]